MAPADGGAGRARGAEIVSGKWSDLATELRPTIPFFSAIRRITSGAMERGEKGVGGGFVWSLNDWKVFARVARSQKFPAFLGNAVYRTVRNVETMLADGKSAQEIHAALYWR